MNRRHRLGMLLMMVSVLALPAWGENQLERNQTLQAQVRKLERELDELRGQAARLQATQSTLETTRGLISGEIRRAPGVQGKKVEVGRFEQERELVIDNRADGKRQVIHRWLKLKPGKTYRFEGQFRIEDGKALQPVKFGGFVQVKGKPTQWPAASLGKEPCDWRPCSFEYTLPFGGSFCLIYGIENGAGRILFRDIAVFEID